MAVSEIAALTWESREKKSGDLVADNVPFYYKLREKGRMVTISGGRIIYEDIMYAQNAFVASIDPAEEIPLGYNQTITAFEISPKIVVVPVVINYLEKAQNQGEAEFKNLLKQRLSVADSTLTNKYEAMLQGDGLGSSGKDFMGIKGIISQTPTLGTIQGISRVSTTSIRNVAVNAVTTFGSATTSANIEARLRNIKNQIVRNTDKPDLGMLGGTYYNALCDALSAKQRYQRDEKMADAGFDNVAVEGMVCVLATGKQFSALTRIDADEAYLLNTSTFSLKHYKGYNMQPLPERTSVNQLVDVAITCGIGNLTCNNPALNACMFDS